MIPSKSFKQTIFIILLLISALTATAQSADTTLSNPKDKFDKSLSDTDVFKSNRVHKTKKPKIYHNDTLHSPQKAVIRSLIIPGWGQVYNKKIWKAPIIYGGLGMLSWAVVFNIKSYREFLQLSLYRYRQKIPKKTDPYYAEYQLYSTPPNYQPDQAIYDAKDIARRDRDLSYLGLIALWGINAVDAYIDSKFIHSYNLDNNFSFHVSPTLLNQSLYAQIFSSRYIPGIKINFTL
ncbi:MAG: DUF5683 domain-containing protein [Bacteroidota bacterium]|nr:DUF5683 domain-containing protein [Bacteroidota bacterium]